MFFYFGKILNIISRLSVKNVSLNDIYVKGHKNAVAALDSTIFISYFVIYIGSSIFI